MPKTLSFTADIGEPDRLASEIGSKFNDWNTKRDTWVKQTKELRNYLYATDTTTTANAILPWSNTTTTPKLTQIADNLHANYFATLFPRMKWMRWEASTRDDAKKKKAETIQAYMETKTRASGFVDEASKLVQDYILYGNCFATVEWVEESKTTPSGEVIPQYTGPRMVRISPYDIVFDPTASSFQHAPKIIRSMVTVGDLARMSAQDPELAKVYQKVIRARETVRGTDGNWEKSEAFVADGFSDIRQYYESPYVEILTFYGDTFDATTGDYRPDRIVTVVDRAYVARDETNPRWLDTDGIFHAGWRERPDNLYAMGPLDNLVGLQYRIDHLENLKADVFDQIAYPIVKVAGDVEDFVFQPGERIYVGTEGDVSYLAPDATALQAELQIDILERRMEEMAGAPKQAMGIRTPGEKTAFEIQTLQNSASRIFEHKTAHFERVFLEPVLNAMLVMARRKMNRQDEVRTIDSATGASIFSKITREDIVGYGKIVPIGARHFAERARRVQNLQNLLAIKQNDPTVSVHLSGKRAAELIATEIGEPDMYGENIALEEQAETQEFMQNLETINQENLAVAEEGNL